MSRSHVYTLADIHQRTGIPLERLRYALDQRLLPGQETGRRGGGLGSRGRGRPRSFTAFEAFGLALATLLLETGLRRQLVRECLFLLARSSVPGSRDLTSVPLHQAFNSDGPAFLDVGDGLNVRLHGSEGNSRRAFDTGWRQLATGAEVRGYEPLVLLRIDAARLRRLVQ